MDNKILIDYAKQTVKYSYAPYSNFHVGAALLTTQGKVFTGCNVENASYGATNCAERTAIFKAVSEGFTSFSKIAIVSENGDFTYPCGMCLQVMSEFMKDGIIVLANNNNEIREYKLSELLPNAFSLKD